MRPVVKSILFACIVHALAACSGGNSGNQSNEMRVNVVRAKSVEVNSHKEFSFMAKPYRASDLSFRIGGPIDRFEVYVGNYYKQGDIIAEIDARDFRIRKERAEAVYNQAKSEFERIEVLFKKNNISASSYEKAKADCTTAKMAYETAVNELGDTKLVAPFNGYIGDVYIEKFQDVRAAQAVVSFVDIERLKIEAYVTQDIAFASADLKHVNLAFDALPEESYTAEVTEVSKSTTRNNLSYLLTALLPNRDGKLLAGMSGKLSFEMPALAGTKQIVIPQTAVCHRPTEGDYVWVVSPGTKQVARRSVTLGGMQPGGMIAVEAGVADGESVAVSGLRFLSGGMTVIVK